MNWAKFKKAVGMRFQLTPVACRLDSNGNELPELSDDWIVDAFSDKEAVTLRNVRTGHIAEIGKDHIYDFRSDPTRSKGDIKYGFLVLKMQVFMQADRLWLYPNGRPGERVEPPRSSRAAAERPWIQVDIAIGGPLYYNVNGANFNFLFRLKNTGRSPATNVVINGRVLAPAIGVDKEFNPIAAQRKMSNAMRAARLDPMGFVIFSGDSAVQQIGFNIPVEELKRITQRVEFICPYLVGFVDYGYAADPRCHHQTGFLDEVRRSDRPRPEAAAKNRSTLAIFPDEGDIAEGDLRLYRSPFGGEYAD